MRGERPNAGGYGEPDNILREIRGISEEKMHNPFSQGITNFID